MDKIAITDTNILIDLLNINLISQLFELKYDFCISNLVLEELKEDKKVVLDLNNQIENLGISIIDSTKEPFIQELMKQYNKLSPADCSCLWLVTMIEAILLSNDSYLRNIAQGKGIEIHGTLWILDQLLANKIITLNLAIEKLELLQIVNPRLPKDESETRLALWRKKLKKGDKTGKK